MTDKEKLLISVMNRLKVVWVILDSTEKKQMSVKVDEVIALKRALGKFMREGANFSKERIAKIDKVNIDDD